MNFHLGKDFENLHGPEGTVEICEDLHFLCGQITLNHPEELIVNHITLKFSYNGQEFTLQQNVGKTLS